MPHQPAQSIHTREMNTHANAHTHAYTNTSCIMINPNASEMALNQRWELRCQEERWGLGGGGEILILPEKRGKSRDLFPFITKDSLYGKGVSKSPQSNGINPC